MLRIAVLSASAVFLTLPACGGGGGGGDIDSGLDEVDAARPDARQPPDADTAGVPRIEPADCRYDIPGSLGLTEGTDYECGDMRVRENRDADTGVIAVHYVRFASDASSPVATIYLDGGPGGNGSSILGWLGFVPQILDGLLAQGDFLIIAQRGTSLAAPGLLCDSIGGCVDEFDAATDLPSFNTAYNADDVDDLRAELGYEALNVYGISYGSRLGLEVLRRHGDNVRAAVLGGLVPSQVVWPAEVPASFYSALTGLDATCADVAGCADAFGDLEADFIAGVDALNQQPVSFDYEGETYYLDGYTHASLLFRMLYSNSTYPWLPLVISDLAERRTDRVAEFLGPVLQGLSGGSDLAYGLYYAVVCGELFNPPDASAFDVANAEVPAPIRDMFSYNWYALLDECPSWPKHTLADAMAEPVAFDGPVFLASGVMDPITPPTFGTTAAGSLPGATHVVYAGSGHGATLQTSCGNQTFLAFLDDPESVPDTSCADAITVEFVLPGAVAAREIPIDRIRLELERAPVPPPILERLERAARGAN